MSERIEAFPTTFDDLYPGMTLRDYFAAKVLAGNLKFFAYNDVIDFDEIASDAYKLADAMIKARGE